MNTLILILLLLWATAAPRAGHPMTARPQPVSAATARLVPPPVLWIRTTDLKDPAFAHVYRSDMDKSGRRPVYRTRYVGRMPIRLMRYRVRFSRDPLSGRRVEWRELVNPPAPRPPLDR